MMTLSKASSFFDRTPVLDVDTSEVLFYGQLNPYDDVRRDTGTGYRRTLSVADGVTIPTSRVVKIHGGVWLVGSDEVDGFSTIHRRNYVIQRADTKFAISSLSDILSGVVTSSSWGSMQWYDDGSDQGSSAKIVPTYTAYFPTSANLDEFYIVWFGSGRYIVGPPHRVESGHTHVFCVKLEYAPGNATLATRTYDPVQGKYTASTTSTVTCMRVRWQSLFLYGSQASEQYKEGDCSLVLPTGTSIATKDTVTLSGKTWNVVSVGSLGGAVVVHGRPA